MEKEDIGEFQSLNAALAALYGSTVRVAERSRVFGGDINESYHLVLTDGVKHDRNCETKKEIGDRSEHGTLHVFMKTNAKDNLPFFRTEAAGLDALRKTGAIGVPQVLGIGTQEGSGGYSFLLMEFIGAKERRSDYWEVFARQLAGMHQAPTADLVPDGVYGFGQDNYIGASRQVNTAHERWIDFFRECRLKPQFESAAHYFEKSDLKKIGRLLEQADRILVEPEHPSLLHGDLWSGNVIAGSDGRAWLIDPAAYVGHAEADLAMTELFGGFPDAFYEAYKKAAPLQPGYERRRDFYNLYHLLNHLNMFGKSYLSSVKRIISRYL